MVKEFVFIIHQVEAGKGAGCKTIYIKNNYYGDSVKFSPDFIADNMKNATDWILNEE